MTGIHEQLEQNPAALRLSKSRIAAFEQCRRRLWLQVHLPQAAATRQDSAKERLKSGALVGAVARTLVPNGVLVEALYAIDRRNRFRTQHLVIFNRQQRKSNY